MNRFGIMSMAALLGMMIALTLPAQNRPVNGSPEAQAPARGNIILITVDSLRADRLDPYTGKSELTPAIGALAERGVMFTRAYAASPSTAPSNATILTGYYPSRHQIRHDLGGYLGAGITTLAERLQRAGYTTGAVIGSFHLDSDRRLDPGFGLYDDDIEGLSAQLGLLSKERRAEEVIDRGLKFFDGAPKGRPWFLWLNLYDPHYGFRPPDVPPEDYRESSYRSAMAHVDAQIGRLTNGLRDRGLLGRTDLVLAGSHGEGLGDHGETGHGIYLYETTIRVPLIIVEGGASDARGIAVDVPVGLVDLAPTILDLVGIEEGGRFDGRSLVPLLKAPGGSKRGAPPDDRTLFVEAVQPREAYGWSPLFAVIQGDRKIVQGRRLEAFDLRSDPGEKRPISPPPEWSGRLVTVGRGLLGKLQPASEVQRAIMGDVLAMKLPWDNSPICLEKQEWPDPRDPEHVELNGSLFEARVNFDQKAVGLSFEMAQEIIKKDPANFTALEMIIFLYVRNGYGDMVPDHLEVFQCNYPFRSAPYHYYGHLLDRMDQLGKAELAYRMLPRIDPLLEDGPYDLAAVFARTGREDEAFAYLEKAIELGATDYEFIRSDVRFVPLREDPRFVSLVVQPPAAGRKGAMKPPE